MKSKNMVDDIDIEIIRTLQKDARYNFADIAKKCGVSTDTISKRFKKLKHAGIIRGTTILLNPKSFGYECVASFGLTVAHLYVKEVADFLRKIPEVVFCSPTIGRCNLFAILVLENIGKLNVIKEYIKGHPKIKELEASIWVDEILLCPENFDFEGLKKG
ncbi:MAG: Lrp/AsnC family transcriptional regulator [Candidatus Hadarchaeum sp.]|uniref:Lrp/AsnC family transcriptional regulator n=1 Tax=Candidatus Hadarchaeum sp. TaxID=2883567 RepID=UPI003180A438